MERERGTPVLAFTFPKSGLGVRGKIHRSFEHRYGESIIAQESKKVLDFGRKRMAGN